MRITVHHEEAAKHASVFGHQDSPSPTSFSPVDEVAIDNCLHQARMILEYQELYNHYNLSLSLSLSLALANPNQ